MILSIEDWIQQLNVSEMQDLMMDQFKARRPSNARKDVIRRFQKRLTSPKQVSRFNAYLKERKQRIESFPSGQCLRLNGLQLISQALELKEPSVRHETCYETSYELEQLCEYDEIDPELITEYEGSEGEPTEEMRILFGKHVAVVAVPHNVQHVYKRINKITREIGGNGSVGPIYGELTIGSMQKMVNLMIQYSHLSQESRFIDIGSGVGKPNFHVAQFPGVSFSCGIEVEFNRWLLGTACLKAVLDEAVKQGDEATGSKILGNTVFLNRDIVEAESFDPFTHVYMFSIGFPPTLWFNLSEKWNSSQSSYLICYHGPKDIIHKYAFEVELVIQTTTSMCVSHEGHMGYIYKRKGEIKHTTQVKCAPIFAAAWDLVKDRMVELHENVSKHLSDVLESRLKTRSMTSGGNNRS